MGPWGGGERDGIYNLRVWNSRGILWGGGFFLGGAGVGRARLLSGALSRFEAKPLPLPSPREGARQKSFCFFFFQKKKALSFHDCPYGCEFGVVGFEGEVVDGEGLGAGDAVDGGALVDGGLQDGAVEGWVQRC